MKRLTLLRHAKSGWDEPVARDFDRPLNAKGRRAARRIGEWLRQEGVRADHVVGSPAIRVVETLEELAVGLGETLAPAWDRRVYLASASTLLDVVQEAPDAADTLMLVGHNPGLEDLALLLIPDTDGARREEVEEKFPTAAIAEIEFDVDRWKDVGANGGTLRRFVRPRDLDPTLGPEHA
ncbi:MAG: histidine phosphatase family protein [Sphingomonas sp.]